ncbi:MAG: hypothetical protein IJE88_08125, partial [Akkermansia sp.]|nr:hypothetical protein [Akkermansia sp.]
HPLTSLGVPGIINTKPSVPPRGGSTLGYYYAALTGSKFRYADAPQTTLQIPIYQAPYSNFGTRVLKILPAREISTRIFGQAAFCLTSWVNVLSMSHEGPRPEV